MQFSHFFLGNKTFFLLILNFLLLILVIFIILLSTLNVTDKEKIVNYNIYISFLSIVLQLVCFTFFGQIFEILIIVFICENNSSIIDNTLECRKGLWFYFDGALCIICLLSLIYFSISSISIFYKPNFIIEENDVLKKTSSFPELILFANKIIFLIIVYLPCKIYSMQWFTLIILFISTFANVISIFYYNNYENIILMKLNKLMGMILFWSIICLISGKIFQNWEFNGIFHLFIIGIIILIFSCFYHKDKVNDFYLIDFRQIDNSQKILKYIKNFMILIKNKDKCRKSFIVFNTLVLLREKNCINKNCKLKRYLYLSEKGLESDFILYQHCQQLFEIAIKKFPNDIILKSNYIVYLVVQMSRKKLALKILATMEKLPFHFQNNYIIYCCKQYIDEYTPSSKKNFEKENKNIMRATEYENIFNIFKESLSKASSLYYEFWSSLYKSHLQGTEDFIKLNDIGEKINTLIDLIDEYFNKMHRVKSDDIKVLNLYSGFLKHILNNKNKYNELKHILDSLSNVDKIQDKEIDFSNFDLKVLNNSDEFKYIIISADENNLGIILNISLNACAIFGYTKNELIGKKINILLPQIFHKQFEKYLKNHTNNIKTHFYDLLSNQKEYFPEFKEMFILGKNKSKYLIPLYVKYYFTQTEENEHIYVVEIALENGFMLDKITQVFNLNRLNTINPSKQIKLSYNYCCVLTDNYFNIQTFTPNSQELLGLNSNALNANVDITNYIDQFKEDVEKLASEENIQNELSKYEKSDLNINYLDKLKTHLNTTSKSIYGLNSISNDKKLLYKRIIAEKKYNEYKLITWKSTDLNQSFLVNQSINNSYDSYGSNNPQNDSSKNIINNNKTLKINKEKNFLLVIQKCILYEKQVGYKFYFRRQHYICIQNEVNSILKTPNESKKNNATFKALESIDDNESINEDDNEENNQNVKSKKFKESKSLNNKKNEKLEILLEEISLRNSFQSDEIFNIALERVGSSPSKTNILKKKPSKFLSLNEPFKHSNRFKSLKSQNLIDSTNYIPNSNFNFIIDLESHSYRPSFKLNKINKTLSILKNEAIAKLNQFQKIREKKDDQQIEFSSFYSSDEESESSEDEDSYSEHESSLNTNIKKKTQIEKERPDNRNPTQIEKERIRNMNKLKEEIDGNYYKIEGINKIKFMIYDFEQEMIVEKNISKDVKSEVENIIIQYKLKLPLGMEKDINNPSLKVNKLLYRYSNKDIKKEPTEFSTTSTTSLINYTKKQNKDQDSFRRIESALNKNDKEEVIIKFFVFTVLTIIIIASIAFFILFYILTNLEVIKSNFFLLTYASNVRHFTNMGIYYVREMTVLNLNSSNFVYQNFPSFHNRTAYIQNISDNLKETYFLGHYYMETMMGVHLDLSPNNSYHLNIKPFKTQIEYDINKTRIVTSSLSTAIVQTYSYFYNLILSDFISYDSKEVRNFMYNSLNNIAIGMENIVKIYFDEISKRQKKFKTSILIYCIVFLIIYIFIYILMNNIYVQIIQRKDSYISVFYGISLSFIKTSMIKCEKFLRKLNPNELLIVQEKNENFDESLSFSNFEEEDYFLLNKNSKKPSEHKINNNKGKEKKIKYKDYSKSRAFKLKFFLFLGICYIYIFLILWSFMAQISIIEIMSKYAYHMQHLHNNLLNLFNAYREFIFNSNSSMHNLNIYEYFYKAEKEVHYYYAKDIIYSAEHCNYVKGLCKVFKEIQKNQLCDSGEEISSIDVCDYYIEVITSLGFFNFISFWVEEIRIRKNYVLLLTEIDKIEKLWKDDEMRIIAVYNSLDIHPDVNHMFISGILTFINQERNLTIEKMIETFKTKNRDYIITMIIYFVLIIIFYIIYLNPIIKGIKILIYKTKNMLTIIPVEILTSQTNIKDILNISDLND